MRPNTRGSGMPGTANGPPPGTSGSGLRSRAGLRTGQQSGPGTMAAQGSTIDGINQGSRPMTGVNQGVMGMKTQAQGQGRLIQDSTFYIGLLRKKITDITNETNRMRNEMEQQSKDNAQYSSLEKKYENLLKTKEKLEGDLADYNLALDKIRTSTDPDDIQQMVTVLSDRNKQISQELDRLFIQRKQRENEAMQIEDQINNHYKQIQSRIQELDPGRLRAYNDLLNRQKDFQAQIAMSESKINEVNSRIRQIEGEEKGHSIRKEFIQLEKQISVAQRDLDVLNEELEIAGLDPAQAHKKFVERVNSYKESTKSEDSKAGQLREEIENLRKTLDSLNSDAASQQEDPEEAAKFELLVKRDQDMTAFMDKFDESKGAILEEQATLKNTIVMLLEAISRDIDDSSAIPTSEAMSEMEAAKNFKQKNLQTAQRTMESLQAERRKRERELEMLKSSEPKLKRELESLSQAKDQMRAETKEMSDIDGLRRKFEKTKGELLGLSDGYNRRKSAIQQQVQIVSQELEALKKQLAGHETAKELEEIEKQLKLKEKAIFEVKETIDTKVRETEYEGVKNSCLKTIDALNAAAIKQNNDGPGAYAQAKW